MLRRPIATELSLLVALVLPTLPAAATERTDFWRSRTRVAHTTEKVVAVLEQVIKAQDTPPALLIPRKGKLAGDTPLLTKRQSDDAHGGRMFVHGQPPQKYTVSNVGKRGIFRTQIALPLPGHVAPLGSAAMEHIRQTQRYEITITSAGGQPIKEVVQGNGSLVTVAELKLRLGAAPTTIEINPVGSLGPSQYPLGRRIVLDWDGT